MNRIAALFIILAAAEALKMNNMNRRGKKNQTPKLFCFAWTNGSPGELEMLPEVEKQLAKCDGYAFYTDKDAPSALDGVKNLVRVDVPSQLEMTLADPTPSKGMKNRNGDHWLYHKNMAGLMPTWTHLLQSWGSKVDSYDWILNTELDHYMRANEVKLTIASWMDQEKGEVDDSKPLMLNFGNAFLFNKGMVKEMKSKWSELNQITQSGNAVGCPTLFTRTDTSCEQDTMYPKLAQHLNVKQLGSSGCGKTPKDHQNQGSLRLPCWDFGQVSALRKPEMQKDFLSKIAENEAEVHREKPSFSRMDRRQEDTETWEQFTPDKHIAIIHHVSDVSVHQFAANVLP
jgi:hypothetical protein